MRPRNTSSALSVQEARRALGHQLRELRRQATLTGRQLAEQLAWPPSKISKLENGRQTPTDDDIRAWTHATHSGSSTRSLLTSLHALEFQHAEWQRQLAGGLRPHQQEIARLDQQTRLFRVFESTFIPGLLQTTQYARARFTQSAAVFDMPNDIDDAVRIRAQRQEILYQAKKRFHIVLTEAALHYRLCPADVMVAQLDRLVSVSAMHNVRLGVVPFEVQYAVAPAHGFWILDDSRVMVETFSAELNLVQPQEIVLYTRIFEQLAAVASYGAAARGVIMRVIESRATESEDAS